MNAGMHELEFMPIRNGFDNIFRGGQQTFTLNSVSREE